MHKTVAATMIGTSVIMTMTLSFLFKSLSSKCNWSLDNMSNSERQMVHHKTSTSGGSNSYVAKMCGPITNRAFPSKNDELTICVIYLSWYNRAVKKQTNKKKAAAGWQRLKKSVLNRISVCMLIHYH